MSSSSFLNLEKLKEYYEKDWAFCPNCKELVEIEYAKINGDLYVRCTKCGALMLELKKEAKTK
jgi:Zn ribbon nucleic-acid-binding protein